MNVRKRCGDFYHTFSHLATLLDPNLEVEIMYVWRIENEDGWGPYATEDAFPLGLSGKNHPGPEDIENWRPDYFKTHRFGFNSVEQLMNWFHGRALVKLYQRGHKIVKYKVRKNAVVFGKHQVAFNYSKAEKIETYDKLTPELLKA
jgi:hypothetical protein